MVAAAAHLVRQALVNDGLDGAVKTSGAKRHVFVPVDEQTTIEEAAAASRALAARAERIDPALATTAYIREERGGKVFLDSTRSGGATVAAAYSPRVRPGVPVSFPVRWDDLDSVKPADFTIHTAADLLGGKNVWREQLPPPQRLPADLIDEGRTILDRLACAMHEGKGGPRSAPGGGRPAPDS